MTRRRFLADELHGKTAVLTGQNAAHLARVLRARVGQEYEIAAEGSVHIGKIVLIEDGRIEFELGPPVESRATTPVTLLAAIFKFDRFEWAIEKATELGVARIVPVIARRTDAHLATSAEKRVERWRRIAHEASQQSRRTSPPEIAEPIKLKDALELRNAGVPPASGAALNILLSEVESGRSLRFVLEQADADSITLAIGPEGGWTDDELQLFASARWTSASLGPNILRAETAVVAALAVAGTMTLQS